MLTVVTRHRYEFVEEPAASSRLDRAYRSATAASNSFRVAMLTRLISALAAQRCSGASQVRQRSRFRSKLGEAMRQPS